MKKSLLFIALLMPAIGFTANSFEIRNNKVYQIDHQYKTIKFALPKNDGAYILVGKDTIEASNQHYTQVIDSFSINGLKTAGLNMGLNARWAVGKAGDRPGLETVFDSVITLEISNFFLKKTWQVDYLICVFDPIAKTFTLSRKINPPDVSITWIRFLISLVIILWLMDISVRHFISIDKIATKGMGWTDYCVFTMLHLMILPLFSIFTLVIAYADTKQLNTPLYQLLILWASMIILSILSTRGVIKIYKKNLVKNPKMSG